jgi:Protein of unknown function (DUF2857)
MRQNRLGGVAMTLNDVHVRLLAFHYLLACPRFDSLAPNAPAAALVRDALGVLSTANLGRLARMEAPRISVRLDSATFDHGIRSLLYVSKRQQEIDHFVRSGATVPMLERLFHVTSHDMARCRGASGLMRTGRPPLPSAARREQIVAAWHMLRTTTLRNASETAQYRELHRQFSDLTLATLNAVVNEFPA